MVWLKFGKEKMPKVKLFDEVRSEEDSNANL